MQPATLTLNIDPNCEKMNKKYMNDMICLPFSSTGLQYTPGGAGSSLVISKTCWFGMSKQEN